MKILLSAYSCEPGKGSERAVGLIFTQMEEPGYMFYTTTLLGLRWQENRARYLVT